MNGDCNAAEYQDDDRDMQVLITAGNHRQVDKTSEDVKIKEHRGNRSENVEFCDDRRNDGD